MSASNSPKSLSLEAKFDHMMSMMQGLKENQEQFQAEVTQKLEETNERISLSRQGSRGVSPTSLARALDKDTKNTKKSVAATDVLSAPMSGLSTPLTVDTSSPPTKPTKPVDNVTTRDNKGINKSEAATKNTKHNKKSQLDSFASVTSFTPIPEGEDESEDEDEEEALLNPYVTTDMKRRKSYLTRTAEEGMKLSQPIQWTKPLPDCLTRLEVCTPAAVSEFFKEINKYSESFGHTPVLSSLLSDNVIHMMKAFEPGIERILGKITTVNLLHVLQGILAPKSKRDFTDKLRDNTSFEPCTGFRLTPACFEAFWTKLVNFEDSFARVIDVLKERALPENIPKLKYVVKIFIDKIPFGYGLSMEIQLDKVQGESIGSYFHRFKKLLQDDLRKTQAAQEVFSRFTGTEMAISQTAAPASTLTNYTPSSALRRPATLANIHLLKRDAALNEEDDLEFDTDCIDEGQYEECLLRMMGSQDQSEMACFQIVQKGVCGKVRCPYSHKPEHCNPARDKQIDEMTRVRDEIRRAAHPRDRQGQHGKYGPASDPSASRHNGPPFPRKDSEQANTTKRNTVSHIRDLEQDDNSHEADLSVIMAQSQLLNICPALSICSAVHTSGNIALGSANLHVRDVLFDNGALSQSYIDEGFVQRNIAQLGPKLVAKPRSVNLAQKGTSAVITGHMDLHVSFRDDQGRDVTACHRFYVFPNLASEMIVGLPTIVRHYVDIFISMIRRAEAIAKEQDEAFQSGASADDHTQPADPHVQLNRIQAGDIVQPWEFDYHAEADEEKAFPEPCSFPTPLHFMGKPIDELRKEYQDNLLPRIAPEFLAAVPEVEQLLRTKGEQVCVPTDWSGIRGVPPLKIQFTADLPPQMKTATRRVNPKILEKARAEFDRLNTHFFKPSKSPYSVGLVIAPKATYPYVRLCGDYPRLNKYMVKAATEIPHVMHELARIGENTIFIEVDMMNAFHQLLLDPETSDMLSIQTPWGQVSPKFVPEGISPATSELNLVSRSAFSDFEWCIALHDNFLLVANSYTDAFTRLEMFLDRCIERNIFLKLSKCNFGVKEVSFFGYQCRGGSYNLSEERRECLSRRPLPMTKTAMASFLGAAQFFQPFVKHYSSIAAPLHEMTKKSFDWQDEPWSDERIAAMHALQEAMYHSIASFYPDHKLDWYLQTDASLVGVGCVLFQRRVNEDDTFTDEPILVASQKFTDTARRWSTHEQEAYAIVWGVHKCKYLLFGKHFTVQTDHANLRFMESSQSPKVMRWRSALSEYDFDVQHIPGSSNKVADWLSRDIAAADGMNSACTDQLSWINAVPNIDALDDKLRTVHGGRNGHPGVRATYRALQDIYPGNTVTYRVCEDFVARCPICQKNRLQMADSLKPMVLSLATENLRDRVGADTLTMSPTDKNGYCYITVIVVHATKLAFLFPTKSKEAIETARAFFVFFAHYGVFHEIQTDMGSDYTSEVIRHLNQWMGIRHRFSIVGRHQSSGVEATNREISRHLRALVADERTLDNWAAPETIFMVQHLLNSTVSSETGKTPFELHFGSRDAAFMVLPEATEMLPEEASEFVKKLDENLQSLRAASKRYQDGKKVERTAGATESEQRKYPCGELVLKQRDKTQPRATKLTMDFEGPFEVLSHERNSVTCRHVNEGYVNTFHVSQLKPFLGSLQQARELAKLDNDQHDIQQISAMRGDPWQRTTCEFRVHFADGTVTWITWNADLFQSIPYEDYCRSRPALMPLLFSAEESSKRRADVNKLPITELKPKDVRYIDLRYFGYVWYDSLGLPESEDTLYLVRAVAGEYTLKKRRIKMHFELMRETQVFTHAEVVAEAWRKTPVQGSHVLDQQFLKQYPQVLSEKQREELEKFTV